MFGTYYTCREDEEDDPNQRSYGTLAWAMRKALVDAYDFLCWVDVVDQDTHKVKVILSGEIDQPSGCVIKIIDDPDTIDEMLEDR